MDNCLEWNLKFWNKNRSYKLYYNSDHVIALEEKSLPVLTTTYLPIECFGQEYFISAFNIKDELILKLLKEYFKVLDANDYGL